VQRGYPAAEAAYIFRAAQSGWRALRHLFLTSPMHALSQVVPLNRYALDYWKHGQRQALSTSNGLRESDAWQELSTFCDCLSVVATALEQTLENQAAVGAEPFHPVVYVLRRLADEYKEKFAKFNG
jgi:hypothetical protein